MSITSMRSSELELYTIKSEKILKRLNFSWSGYGFVA